MEGNRDDFGTVTASKTYMQLWKPYLCRMTTAGILEKIGIKQLNEMQEAMLKAAEKPGDIVLLSPTGSGKTLGFLLPLLQTLDPEKTGLQALIITPTRELALQIESVFRAMGTAFNVNTVYGGHSIRVEQNNFSGSPAVVIGTPGRLNDHLKRGNLDLSAVKTLVLDEFDKSLEMGFQEEMTLLIQELKTVSRRLLTSATDIETIPEFTGIANPTRLVFGTDAKSRLQVHQVVSPDADKLDTLLDLLCNLTPGRVIIFSNHRESCERISDFLYQSGIVNVLFHGGLEQDDRERALIKFRNGSAFHLVATDLAARGLDIPEISHVIHYQLPLTEDAFIHRNGRTARQSASGQAILIRSEKESLPEYIGEELPMLPIKPYEPLPEEPQWVTLYFGGGKKDKINKMDIVGFLSKVGMLEKDEIGIVTVLDHSSFAAVPVWKKEELLPLIRNQKIKGKKPKIGLAR